MARRYFEFVEGTSSKFWEVWVEGNECRTRYGKIGAAGQTTVKDEGSPAAAQRLHDKLVKEKTGKGYAEKTSGALAGPASERVTQPMEAKPKKVVPAKAPSPAPAAVEVEAGYLRWENTEDGASKFWEIKLEDAAYTVRWGRIGAEGQEKTKDFDDATFAEDEADKLIAEKVRKGYRPVGTHGPDTGATNHELEREIAKNPADPNGYLVYADWLSAQGDPRGELIVVQHQAQKKGDLWKTSAALIKKHRARFFGAFADFEAGDEQEMDLGWENGFVKSATLKWAMYSDDYGADRKAGKQLRAFLELPVTRFLRSLRLGPSPSEDEMTFQHFIDAIVATGKPAHLEELYLGDIGDWDISGTSTGDFSQVAAVAKHLVKVTLRAGNVTVGKVDLPRLRELVVESGSLRKDALKDIVAMKAPHLERLSIWFGSKNYGASGGLKDIHPILEGAFPKLTHLGLMNCEFVNEAALALAKSKLLPKLKSVDLSMGCLDDDTLAKLAATGAFAHLDELNVDDNALSDPKHPTLKGLAKKVLSTTQEVERAGEDAWRFCSVGE